MTLQQEQFQEHLEAFQKQSGVDLYGTHAVVGGIALPTVSQNLVVRPVEGGHHYYLESRVRGSEGNLHNMGVQVRGDNRFYSFSAERPGVRYPEYHEASDPVEFSRSLPGALARSTEFPPSETKPEGEFLSSAAGVAGTTEELHRTGRYGNITVNVMGSGKHSFVYDPVTETHR